MEFNLNPSTGTYEAGDGQKKAPSGLRKATFRDEQGADVYHIEIPVTGGRVYAREMDDDTFREFVVRNKQFQEVISRPMLVEQEAMQLEAQNKFNEAMTLRLQSQAESTSAQNDNKAFTKWMLEKTLAGWSFDRPFSLQAFAQLGGDDQQVVVLRVIRASNIGRDDQNFTQPDSSVP